VGIATGVDVIFKAATDRSMSAPLVFDVKRLSGYMGQEWLSGTAYSINLNRQGNTSTGRNYCEGISTRGMHVF
jgi:hypothetical protein